MKTNIWAITLGVATGIQGLALAQAPGNPTRSTDSSFAVRMQRSTETKNLARSLLLKRVEEVDWLEATFEEVLDWLAGQGDYKVNLIPHWRSLIESGVEREAPVTLKVRDMTVAEILNEVMDQLSETGSLRYVATGNTIRITTRRALEKNMETRVYRVTDLVFSIPDMARSAPVVDLDAASRQNTGQGGGGGGGGGQGVFGGSTSSGSEDLEEEPADLLERLEGLKTIIEAQIEPTTWQTNGGVGVISVLANDRELIITNTIDVHEKIGGFFSR